MICETTVKFRFLRFCQRWRSPTTNNAVPDGLNQLDLFVNIEHTCLL